MLEFKEIHPCKGETYQIAHDDGCLVLKSGSDPKNQNMVWISTAMAAWIALNFADETCIDIKVIKE